MRRMAVIVAVTALSGCGGGGLDKACVRQVEVNYLVRDTPNGPLTVSKHDPRYKEAEAAARLECGS